VRAALATAYARAIAAVDPERVARAALRREGARLVVRGRGGHAVLPLVHGIVVVGAGKGSAGLAAGVEAVLGPDVVDGVVVVPPGYERGLTRVAVVHGGHPLPDRRSVAAVARVLAVLARHPRAAVLVVLAGGASSLLAAPAPGLTLGDLRRTSAWLLASGIDIGGMNVVRKHLAAIGGGRLAAHLVGRAAVAIVVSDVPSDDLAVIGSGPTVADPTTYADALRIVAAAGRANRLPARVRRHLQRGARGDVSETPKPGSAAARVCPTLLVAGNATARSGAAAWGKARGFATVVVRREPFAGDTLAVARGLARTVRRVRAALRGSLPALVIAGGETTVRLFAGAGRGGRNQELAAALALALAGVEGWALLAAGSDGIDGPTDAAGAFADGSSARRAARAGSALPTAVGRHDVYPALAGISDLFRPGPTGTNVADLVIALVWKDCGWRLPRRVLQPSGRR
jgi:glycerate-2-kinase